MTPMASMARMDVHFTNADGTPVACSICGAPAVALWNVAVTMAAGAPLDMQPVCDAHNPFQPAAVAVAAAASGEAAETVPASLTWEAWRAHVYRTVRDDLSQERTLVNATLGLAGESGEIADHIKKWQWQGHDLDHTHLVDELGDLLWYWTVMVSELGFTAEEVMLENIAKLRRRYPNGFDSERSRHRAEDEEGHQEDHQEGEPRGTRD